MTGKRWLESSKLPNSTTSTAPVSGKTVTSAKPGRSEFMVKIRPKITSISPQVRSSVSKTLYQSSTYTHRTRKPTQPKFGQSSVSAPPPRPTRKIRYNSSTCSPSSVLSPLLIIGRSKVQVLLGPPFFIVFIDL